LVGRSSPSPVPSGVCGSATALMSAAAAGHVEIIAALLAADAKPDATNDYGCRPRWRLRSRSRGGQQRAGADGGAARRDTAEGLAGRVGKAAEYADAVRKVPNRSVSSGAACECRGRSALGRRSSLNSTNRTRARRRRAQAARAKVLRRALRREKAEVRGQFRPRIGVWHTHCPLRSQPEHAAAHAHDCAERVSVGRCGKRAAHGAPEQLCGDALSRLLSALHCSARVQRLALLTTLMLARERLPPTAAADEFVGLASAVAALPSGLLAMVGGAITRLDSQLEVRLVSEHCRVLQSTAEHCRVLPSTAEHCRVLPSTAEHCRVQGRGRTVGGWCRSRTGLISSLCLACEGSPSQPCAHVAAPHQRHDWARRGATRRCSWVLICRQRSRT
jgi:hypothetical protein